MHKSKYTPGAIGTKLGTFIIDDNLTISSEYVPINHYSSRLFDSINMGIKWMEKAINNTTDNKYNKLLDKFNKFIKDGQCTDELNQSIIDVSHDLLYKIDQNKVNDMKISQEIKNIKKGRNSPILGPDKISDITEKDIDLSRGLMVQTSSGKYELYLYVRHRDHNDILPYDYIIDKVKSLPNLVFNGFKIN